jgi:hypothetical protein
MYKHSDCVYYRLNVDLFKVLLGINLILWKLLLLLAKISIAIH